MSPRAEIAETFRERGIRLTSQRYAILEHLTRNPQHPTAEEIHQAINRTDPRASLATVYKSLHALAKAGLVRAVHVAGDAVRYESNTESHHHFVCEGCGRVEDLPWFEVPQVRQGARLGRRKIHRYELVLRGLCRACQ
jgi:Fur family peroxide stress response transcriptional regulator